MTSRRIRRFTDLVGKGENPNGYTGVLGGNAGGGSITKDPTQGPPSGSGIGTPTDRDGQRWGQHDRGSRDTSGHQHDW